MDSEAHARQNKPPCPGFKAKGLRPSGQTGWKTSEHVQDPKEPKAAPKILRQSAKCFPSDRGSEIVRSDSSGHIFLTSTQSIPGVLLDDISCWIARFNPAHGARGRTCFDQAMENPPISVGSLQELEPLRVLNNHKLRHDINFDKELHFRPNSESLRRYKTLEVEEYWIALETELELYDFMIHDPEGHRYRQTSPWVLEFAKSQKRIPKAFETIKSIIETLISVTSCDGIRQMFDIPFIMQQIQQGILDVASLMRWLAKLLKQHCAPVRDSWIDRMAENLSTSARNPARSIVSSVKEVFGILEAMKLDIANHQIRTVRRQLISNTTTFERLYNRKRMAEGLVDLKEARYWYSQTPFVSGAANAKLPYLFRFTCCLVRSLLPVPASRPHAPPLPRTFSLDFDRLYKIHSSICAAVNEEICILRLRAMLHQTQRSRQDIESLTFELRRILPIIVGTSWTNAVGNVAAELTRLANKLPQFSHADKHSTQVTSPAVKSADEVEQQLQRDLLVGGTMHRHQTESFGIKVLNTVNALVERYADKDAFELYQMFVESLSPASNQGSQPKLSRGATDAVNTAHPNAKFPYICIRLAHIVLLQWRTWGPLVYEPERLSDLKPEGRCKEDEIYQVSDDEDETSENDSNASDSEEGPFGDED